MINNANNMKIILSGVETFNKGAELMLYAILQEIERKYPKAIVYIPNDRLSQGIHYVKTKLDFRVLPCSKLEKRLRLPLLFMYLRIPYRFLPHSIITGKIDYYIDGSGFRFSDKLSLSQISVKCLGMRLSSYYRANTRIIYLPQAFGPLEKKNSKEAIKVIGKYSSLIMPREIVSYRYIENLAIVDMSKVKIFPDFTSLVRGNLPSKYDQLSGGICVIPNMRMIDKGAISYDDYVNLLLLIIQEAKKSSRTVFLLNHEGQKDEALCFQCQSAIGDDVEVVTGLNALEVKGLIASSYAVVTSRFHGLASALNSGVPCLATSWSHKYEEMFRDYNLEGFVIPLDDKVEAIRKIQFLLNEADNLRIREYLSGQVPLVREKTLKMWSQVWSV